MPLLFDVRRDPSEAYPLSATDLYQVFETSDVPYFVIKDNQFETAIQLAVVTFILGKETFSQALIVGQATNQPAK